MKQQIKLPMLLERKIYKTGQTRGADDDAIYQNRVARNSTVLIPYDVWDIASHPPAGESSFEKRFIALISPKTFFLNPGIQAELLRRGLKLGENALVFYETREDWIAFNPISRKLESRIEQVISLGRRICSACVSNSGT